MIFFRTLIESKYLSTACSVHCHGEFGEIFKSWFSYRRVPNLIAEQGWGLEKSNGNDLSTLPGNESANRWLCTPDHTQIRQSCHSNARKGEQEENALICSHMEEEHGLGDKKRSVYSCWQSLQGSAGTQTTDTDLCWALPKGSGSSKDFWRGLLRSKWWRDIHQTPLRKTWYRKKPMACRRIRGS